MLPGLFYFNLEDFRFESHIIRTISGLFFSLCDACSSFLRCSNINKILLIAYLYTTSSQFLYKYSTDKFQDFIIKN